MTMAFEEFCAHMSAQWFEEDWPPVISSKFMTLLGKYVFDADWENYHNGIARLLCSCSLPCQGLTLFKANCNFHTDQFTKPEDPLNKLDMFASFSAGEICIANESPVASRLEWTGFKVDGKDDPIKNDKFHTVDGVTWPAHHVNTGQFFTVI